MFSGRVPLLQWRIGVLFPGISMVCAVAQPHDIQMVAEACAGECLLGIFSLKERRRIYSCDICDEVFIDWPSLSIHQIKLHRCQRYPEVRPDRPAPPPATICVAQIRRAQPLPHGGAILRVLGIARARVVQELPGEKPYRVAQVDLVGDPVPLRQRPQGWLAEAYQAIQNLRGDPPLHQDPGPPGVWLDILCHLLPLPVEDKQRLLDEVDLESRYKMLAQRLPSSQPNLRWSDLLPPLSRAN
ncbi:LON peptidase substrate-binding domain-containing protein [bacterium]|nr:LON peptidase substrate-binding domain-containing protein [bacterium]